MNVLPPARVVALTGWVDGICNFQSEICNWAGGWNSKFVIRNSHWQGGGSDQSFQTTGNKKAETTVITPPSETIALNDA